MSDQLFQFLVVLAIAVTISGATLIKRRMEAKRNADRLFMAEIRRRYPTQCEAIRAEVRCGSRAR